MKSKYIYIVRYNKDPNALSWDLWGVFSSYKKAKKGAKLWGLKKAQYAISNYTVNYRFISYYDEKI